MLHPELQNPEIRHQVPGRNGDQTSAMLWNDKRILNQKRQSADPFQSDRL
jgi:hypothetical protein